MDLLSRMATFVRVVEAGSLSAAARQLRVSVAAVSRHVTELEASVKITLIARTTRRSTVTLAGQRYYDRCLRVLREVESAQAVGGELDDAPIRISVPVTVGVEAGAALIGPLLAAHPELRIELRLEDRVIDLALDDVDIAIRVARQPPLSDQIIAQPLTRWSRILVASPAYLRRRGAPISPEALVAHDVLNAGRDARWSLVDVSSPGSAAERQRGVVDIDLVARVATNGGHALRALAIAGHGIALVPAWFVARDLARRRLRRVLPAWEAAPTTIYVLYRAELRKQRRVKRIVEHLLQVYPTTER